MDIAAMQEQALALRERLAADERRRGREWTTTDLLAGLMVDVGDLARLLQQREGLRPAAPDLQDALTHEVGDCLWALLVLADRAGVDPAAAFQACRADVGAWLDAR